MSFQLYNFRGKASEEHQAFLVQVAREYLMESNADCYLIGHDSRPASSNIALALWKSISKGTVAYLGQCSTPAAAFTSRRNHCPAVIVTASHNAWDQVGLKLFDKDGVPISPLAEENLMLRCKNYSSLSLTLPDRSPRPSCPSVLDEYFDMLKSHALSIEAANIAVEVGLGWVQEVQRWLPGFQIKGAARTDPSTTTLDIIDKRIVIRVDEDLDKLALWVDGRAVPGQLLLARWLTLRPIGSICLSFDVTMFTQHYLKELGYHIMICPVGDQFVASEMTASGTQTGGEPNGHYIAAERSLCPDALASAIDLLEGDSLDLPGWRSATESHYSRGVVSPFQLTLEESADKLSILQELKNFQFSYQPKADSIIATYGSHRVILRVSRFERVAVIQAEGADAEHLFNVVSSCFPIGSTQRSEVWTE